MSNELFLQLCQWGMYAFQTITYTYINMLLLNSKWKHKVSGFFCPADYVTCTFLWNS